jgi:hypothetical protein
VDHADVGSTALFARRAAQQVIIGRRVTVGASGLLNKKGQWVNQDGKSVSEQSAHRHKIRLWYVAWKIRRNRSGLRIMTVSKMPFCLPDIIQFHRFFIAHPVLFQVRAQIQERRVKTFGTDLPGKILELFFLANSVQLRKYHCFKA